MKSTHLIAVLIGLAAVCIFATDASAYYDPGTGRFLSRDPGPGVAMRVGGGGPAVAGGFIPRDPTGQYADGMNLYQYVRSNPAIYSDPSGLKCACCCVRDLSIGNNKRIDEATRWGTSFDVTIKVEYKEGGAKQGLTDCQLEYWEKTDRPPTWQGVNPDEWHDGYANYPQSPTFARWRNRKKGPIPGTEKIVINDRSQLGIKSSTDDVERTVYFAIRVTRGQSEECAKVCRPISITAFATQYLKIVNGKGDTETFTLGIPQDERWSVPQ